MKTVLIVLGIIALVFTLVIGGFALFLGNGLAPAEALSIGTIDASGVSDGTYEGEYNGGRFSNKVAVTVQGGRITKIDVLKTVTFERPELTQKLIDGIIAGQSADVDVESGATATANAYLKSVENALNSNERKD